MVVEGFVNEKVICSKFAVLTWRDEGEAYDQKLEKDSEQFFIRGEAPNIWSKAQENSFNRRLNRM